MAIDRTELDGTRRRWRRRGLLGVLGVVLTALVATGCVADHRDDVTVITVQRGPDGAPCRAAAAVGDSFMAVDGVWDGAVIRSRVQDLARYLPQDRRWATEVLLEGSSDSIPAVDDGVGDGLVGRDDERAWAALDHWSVVMCERPLLLPFGGEAGAGAARAEELIETWERDNTEPSAP